MSLQAQLLKAREQSHLISAMLELTYSCELDCVFCYNDRELRGRRLTLADYEQILDDLADLGCLYLTLTGGEPLNHPDFFAIGAKAKRAGFVVRIKSHASRLKGELLRRLVDEVDPANVDVSLHGATAQTHERMTQRPGSFAALLESLDELRQTAISIRVNTTLTRWNEGEIEDMFALMDARGLDLFVDFDVTPKDNGDRSQLVLSASDEGRARVRALLKARAQRIALPPPPAPALPKTTVHCGAGTSVVVIDPFGAVYPCVQWRTPLGRIGEESLHEIWRGARVEEVRQQNRETHEWVVASGTRGFCPGLARNKPGGRKLAIVA